MRENGEGRFDPVKIERRRVITKKNSGECLLRKILSFLKVGVLTKSSGVLV